MAYDRVVIVGRRRRELARGVEMELSAGMVAPSADVRGNWRGVVRERDERDLEALDASVMRRVAVDSNWRLVCISRGL